MTAAERAKELYEGVLADCMNVTGQHAGCASPAVHIEDGIRAALRERDARWAAAVKAFIKRVGAPLSNHCPDCVPVRALLEEAGK